MQMLRSKRVVRALEKLGYSLKRISGSEFHYTGPNGAPITITLGHAQISSNSVRKALRQGEKTWEEFLESY